jgi:sugar-phosphatase
VQLEASALIFDSDGVLVDSMGAVEHVWRVVLSTLGFEPDLVFPGTIGISAAAALRRLLSSPEVPGALDLFEQLAIESAPEVGALPGAVSLTSRLPPDRWGIVTSGTRRVATARLTAAGIPIPGCLVCADDVTRGKPHPEPYLAAIRALAVRAEECIVVEDSAPGVKSAQAAGARVIAVATTHPIGAFPANYWLHGLTEIEVEVRDSRLHIKF